MSRDPSLAAELAEFKRKQAEAIRQQREAAAPSSMLAKFPPLDAEPRAEAVEGAPFKCSFCNGTGMVGGLFSKCGCAACDETGYDLSDPVAVIKHLLAGGRKLRQIHQSMKRDHREFRGLWSEEEIKARAETKWVEKHHSRFD